MKAIVKNDGEKQDIGVKEDNEEKEEKTQDTTENKQFDENVPVKQAREEKVDQRAKPGVLVRQDTVIKEPLDAAMAELAASIDGLDMVTPRGGDKDPVEKVRAPACLVPTSDFEEEWRSESEDGDAGEQLVQVVVRMAGVPETSMLLRVGRHGVEKLNIVDSASLSPKWRRTMVPIIIGEMPTNAANSRSSGKKVAEEEEEEGGGEGPEFADSSALGDLDRLASPHQGPGHSGRSVSPLRLGAQTQRRGRGVQTEHPPLLTTNEVGTATDPSAAESEESVVKEPEVEVTKEGEVTKENVDLDVELKESFVKETQTEDVGGEEREVQTEDMEGADEGTQTIPVAMSQATMQTEPQPIQVSTATQEFIPPKINLMKSHFFQIYSFAKYT